MIRALRQLLGMAIGLVAVVAPAWGLFHIVREPACGSDSGGPACPGEVGLWIAAIVVSFVVLAPLAMFIAGRDRRTGTALLLAPIILMGTLCAGAAVVLSLAGPSSDPDTRWVGWLVGGLLAIIVVANVRALVRMRARVRRAAATGEPTPAAFAAAAAPAVGTAAASPPRHRRLPRPPAWPRSPPSSRRWPTPRRPPPPTTSRSACAASTSCAPPA